MDPIEKNQHFFALLRVAMEAGEQDLTGWAKRMPQAEAWPSLYRLAAEQGVLAIAWDGLQRLVEAGGLATEQLPDRRLKLQWAFSAEQIEKRYCKQEQTARELAAAFAERGIDLYVLKGLAVSSYYPLPHHRECGDLDCFLMHGSESAYEVGNCLAEELGADVKRGYYKHSHIRFKGLMVENHQFCTAIRGRKERKAFERHLRELLLQGETRYIGSSKLIQPSADFTALFLTAHGLQHFLSEGIKLRHILDWALLLQAEQEHINWSEFYAWCDRMHFTKFVHALTAIAVDELGLEIRCSEIVCTGPYKERVLDDVLYYGHSVFNTKGSSMRKRWMLVQNNLKSRWKYRELCDTSAFAELLRAIWAFLFERNPKID